MRFDSQDGILYLSKRDVVALTTFASGDKTRPHLASVYVDPRAARCVATDGHRIVVATGRTNPNGGGAFLVPAVDLEEAAKIIKAKDELAVSAVRDDSGNAVVRIVAGKSTSSAAAQDVATYPMFDQILALRQTTDSGADRLGINAVYLADLLAVQKAAEVDCVTLDAWTDELTPLWFEARGHDATWVGCIMPCRV